MNDAAEIVGFIGALVLVYVLGFAIGRSTSDGIPPGVLIEKGVAHYVVDKHGKVTLVIGENP